MSYLLIISFFMFITEKKKKIHKAMYTLKKMLTNQNKSQLVCKEKHI